MLLNSYVNLRQKIFDSKKANSLTASEKKFKKRELAQVINYLFTFSGTALMVFSKLK